MVLIIRSKRRLFLLKKKLFMILVVFLISPYLFYLLLGNKFFTYYVPALASYGYREMMVLWRLILTAFTFYDFGF